MIHCPWANIALVKGKAPARAEEEDEEEELRKLQAEMAMWSRGCYGNRFIFDSPDSVGTYILFGVSGCLEFHIALLRFLVHLEPAF